MNKYNIQNKILWGALVLVAVVSVGSLIARAYSGSAPQAGTQVIAESGSTVVINNAAPVAPARLGGEGDFLGAAPVAGNATYLAQEPKPTAFGSTYFSGDLEIAGQSWLVGSTTIAGRLVVGGTTTVGYATNLLNVPQVAMTGNTTTPCSVQNTSGVDRIISNVFIASTGSTGNGAVTQWRGYVSAGRADMNAVATATIFSQKLIPVSATGKGVWGGPTPNSYFSSTTLAGLTFTLDGFTTTSPVIWPNGWYANVTSTAISSSTGNCTIGSLPL